MEYNGDPRGTRTHISQIKSLVSLPIRRENHGIPCRNPTHISESVAPRPLLWTNGIKLVLHTGLEPVLDGFWIHFLYQIGILEHMVSRAGLEPARFSVVGLRPTAIAAMPPADKWSGWRDSNSRPSGPRPDALRKLSYAPKLVLQTGVEPALNGFSFRFLCQNWDTGAYSSNTC